MIGIIRKDPLFLSGDMLLLDSTLTYGGHILSNLRLVEQIKKTNFETVRARSQAISCELLEQRPLAIKARDALAWLFTPYL